MMELEPLQFNEIPGKIDEPYILFGSGNIAEETLAHLNRDSVSFVVDNSEDLQDGAFLDLPIRSPDVLNPGDSVIITSTAIGQIAGQLLALGLDEADFVVSPALNDRISIFNLEQIQTQFYFTSGTFSPEDGSHALQPKNEGGLFHCNVDGLHYEYERLWTGPCYGSIRQDDQILFIDTDQGLLRYADGNVDRLAEFPSGYRAHGLSYNSSNGCYYIACSKADLILELNESYKIEREIQLSEKARMTSEPVHHCNDCFADGQSLFVSMFSGSGNWKRDSFDGTIAEYDLESGERLRDLVTTLWMPHNVEIIEDSMHVLDSLRGQLKFNNFSVQASWNSFTRGLDYDGTTYAIGLSKNRNHSKLLGISDNVSIDCGISLYLPEIGVSRTIALPRFDDIHSITY
jgi:hypothetical protein